MTPSEAKAEMRQAAYARRKAAHAPERGGPALARVEGWIAERSGITCISAYAPIRTEIDVFPLLPRLHAAGLRICLPVVVGAGQPLVFRPWTPGAEMVKGAFGAMIPADPAPVTPDGVIAPLLAFDRRGYRLGYGGGFYDRTLTALRQTQPVPAIGLAYAAQEVPVVPTDATDVALDAIATEAELISIS